MEKKNTLIHFSTQQDTATGFCDSNCCAHESIWITLITSNCSIPFLCLQLESKIDDVPRQTTSLYEFMAHPRDYIHVQCECPANHYVTFNHTDCTITTPDSSGLGIFNPATEQLQYFQKLMTAYQLTQWRKIPENMNQMLPDSEFATGFIEGQFYKRQQFHWYSRHTVNVKLNINF
jgi:hypothetical protein